VERCIEQVDALTGSAGMTRTAQQVPVILVSPMPFDRVLQDHFPNPS
jgi:hypothetical protein